jgi:transcriptional regulator with XRE-family HTH domain
MQRIFHTSPPFDLRTPTRSPLYSQRPMGVGGPLVESLTGYFSRLASAHSLTVSALIDHEIFTAMTSAVSNRRLRRRLFHASCFLLDGSESHTQQWIDALEAATFQSHLRDLTLVQYAKLCGSSWLRRKRVWCPRCYEEWHLNGNIVYEPLIWAIKIVSLCPLHNVSLVEACPHCHKAYAPLAGRSCPGYCGHCLGWLGDCSEIPAKVTDSGDPEGYRFWCCQQIGLLVEASPQIQAPFERETTQRALSRYIKTLTPVSLSALAEATNCSRRSIAMWMQGTTLPRIESLCRLCFHLGVPVLSLLRGIEANVSASSAIEPLIPWQRGRGWRPVATIQHDGFATRDADSICDVGVAASPQPPEGCVSAICAVANEEGESARSIKEGRLRAALENALKSDLPISPRAVAISVGYSSPDRVLKKFFHLCNSLTSRRRDQATKRRAEIRSALDDALLHLPPPTLNELAIGLNMSSSSVLRAREPSLCDRVLSHREDWRRKSHAVVKVILERALEEDDIPPLRRFCKSSGISIDFVTSCFPEQKKAFDERYRGLRAAKRLRRSELLELEVGRIVRLLRERDEYPSVGRVVAESPSLRSGGWDKLQRAIRMELNTVAVDGETQRVGR